jgi:hypothetical protein
MEWNFSGLNSISHIAVDFHRLDKPKPKRPKLSDTSDPGSLRRRKTVSCAISEVVVAHQEHND